VGGHRGVHCEEGRVVEDGLPSVGDRDTGRRQKRRKGSTRASTSRRRSSGSPAQTLASIGTSVWWWSSEAAAPEGDLLFWGNAGGAAVSSSSIRAPTAWCCKSPWAAATDSWASSSPPFRSPPRRTRCSRPGLTHRRPQAVAPPRELDTLDTTALVHPGLFTKAVLAASSAEVVIGEVEHSRASWSGTAAPLVSR